MLADLPVDLGTVALLAFVVWLDGWRRLPAGSLLVTRSGVGPWSVRDEWPSVGPFALVASFAPITVPVVVSPQHGAPEPAARWNSDFDTIVARTTRRLRRIGAPVAVLRTLGFLMTAWIIVGIPVATERFGGMGLIAGVLGAFALALIIAIITALSMRHALGISVRRSLRATVQLLSPFTAPRATEILLTAVIGPSGSLAPIAALLGERRFLAWIRPWAYDTLTDRAESDAAHAAAAALVAALPRRILERAVELPIGDPETYGGRHCPRCARTYRDVAQVCVDCDDLELVATGPAAEHA